MDKNKMFAEYLKGMQEAAVSAEDKEVLSLIESGFKKSVEIMEGPYVWDQKSSKPMTRRGESRTQETPEEIAEKRAALQDREKRSANKERLAKGVKTQILNMAKRAPLEMEDFLSDIKVAIKEGKAEIDSKFGTDTSKRSMMDRFKGAVKGFTESEEIDEEFLAEASEYLKSLK